MSPRAERHADTLETFPDGEAFSGSIAAGAALGQCYDNLEITGTSSAPPAEQAGVTVYPQPGNLFLSAYASTITAGVGLVVRRGVLQAASTSN